jgi:hypothetical protein
LIILSVASKPEPETLKVLGAETLTDGVIPLTDGAAVAGGTDGIEAFAVVKTDWLMHAGHGTEVSFFTW